MTALVEWPVGVAGQFDDAFLELPPEVIISTLQDHQRCFAIVNGNEELLPWFVAISNIESKEPEQVRAGNERVVRPRLADAAFFYAALGPGKVRRRALRHRYASVSRLLMPVLPRCRQYGRIRRRPFDLGLIRDTRHLDVFRIDLRSP